MEGTKIIQQLLRPTDTCVFVSCSQFTPPLHRSIKRVSLGCQICLGSCSVDLSVPVVVDTFKFVVYSIRQQYRCLCSLRGRWLHVSESVW